MATKTAKAAGIRVSQLAKELNIESKAILAKLSSEGLGDVASSHASMIRLGLAESVREWFAHGGANGGGGTAVETAPPIDAAPHKPRNGKKKKSDSDSVDASSLTQAGVESEIDAPKEELSVEVPAVAPVIEKTEDAPPALPAPTVQIAPTPVVTRTTAAPIDPVSSDSGHDDGEVAVAPPAPAVLKPASIAPTSAPAIKPAAPVRPAAAGPTGPGGIMDRPPIVRETVTLASRQAQAAASAPARPIQMLVPRPATVQGPKIVRVEAAEPVSAPRGPRRPGDNAGPNRGPSFGTATPQTGRGVRVLDDDEEEKKRAAAKKGAGSLSSRRRGSEGRRGEAMEKLKEFTEADLIARRDALNDAASTRRIFEGHLKKNLARGTHAIMKSAAQRGEPIEIAEPITVKSLSGTLGVKSNDIIKKLMSQGVFASVNQSLDPIVAATIALEYGVELHVAKQETMDETLAGEFAQREAKEEDLRPRPPVVTILGHVDHGKTSLLDKIRSANVAAGEAGGITQHTAAWTVNVGEGEARKRVTFIDTPGHQAFTSMRARGANMTDVVVLVVSAAEGVQPQTIESINHAKAADVPIIVAMNKIDREDAQPDMILGQLAAQGLNPVEWGGDTEVIRTSAHTGQGIPELIEILDYQSQLLDLKADPTAPATGTVIESRVDAGLGSVATVLVQNGTLKVGDVILSGPGYGRIRLLLDDKMKNIAEAGPSTPVIVSGLNELPAAGDKFYVVNDVDRARAIAEERAMQTRQDALAEKNKITTAGNLLSTLDAKDVRTINLIIKGDVQGSVETLVKTVGAQNTDEVKVRVIHSGVGGITESDVELAMATKAKPTDNRVSIIGFHVVPDDAARSLAEQNHVEFKLYRVIYEIFDDLKKALSGMLTKEVREKHHGFVEIRAVFKVSKVGNIAGCFATEGHIVRTDKLRLIRDGKVITENLGIETLRRVKDDVKEVKAGLECGLKIAGYDDIKVGDKVEAYITEEFERTL